MFREELVVGADAVRLVETVALAEQLRVNEHAGGELGDTTQPLHPDVGFVRGPMGRFIGRYRVAVEKMERAEDGFGFDLGGYAIEDGFRHQEIVRAEKENPLPPGLLHPTVPGLVEAAIGLRAGQPQRIAALELLNQVQGLVAGGTIGNEVLESGMGLDRHAMQAALQGEPGIERGGDDCELGVGAHQALTCSDSGSELPGAGKAASS